MGSQLCDQLRSLIVSGRLGPGERLPSTRELATDLGISRSLALEAFEQLEAEGYIEGQRGSGSYVRPGAAIASRRIRRGGVASLSSRPAARAKGASQEASPLAASPDAVDFRPGRPELRDFPREAWARALAEAARTLPDSAFGYSDGAGLSELREEAAAFLFRSRGLSLDPEDLFITSGISQALGMASRFLLCGPLSRVILENPCQPALSGLLAREGRSLFAANVDDEGMDPESLPRDKAALAFVTPSHQYPLGPVLSAPRRSGLVEWARATDSIIFEDDFDGDFRYGGAPLQPLRELDPSRVLYAGSFSKSFSPGLRLGYAIVPPRLREGWRACRELADIHSSAFTQAAMASFLASGAYERHVAKMRKVYAERRAAMLAALAERFGDAATVLGSAAGLHVAVRFRATRGPAPRFDERSVSRIASLGAIVYPLSRYAFSPYPHAENSLLLGYGHLEPEQIQRGVAALADALGRG
jgi:Transcriptional regulators containing a DNA-binding HTH domain and an aminotransferase domain (MocR family) and their eukaryotic orthologs